MLKNELKAALAIMGTVFVPLFAQADQPMSTTQGQQQQPGYVSGEMVKAGQLPGAYNQSATYMCDSGWDVFLTGDYIYWDWVQDGGMSLGLQVDTDIASYGGNFSPVGIVPGYASGFQVGLGFNMHGMDDWNFYGEYTWYKNSENASNAIVNNVTTPSIVSNINLSGDISLKYSNADFLLQRPFYFGKKLTSNFYTGLKALWITRETNASASGTATLLSGSLATLNLTSFNFSDKTSSWGLGPKFGMDSNWLLGYGFKILSNVSASVLYTRYTESTNTTTVGTSTFVTLPVSLTAARSAGVSNYGTIRPILETYLGLGWGSFFCDDSFHFDLSVGYDFNVYWDYVTVATLAGAGGTSNMYLHGLNIQARFDF